MNSLTEDELRHRLDAAIDWSHDAGELILGYFQSSGLKVDRKSDTSPVTDADRNAETLLRNHVAELFPQDGFLGEEHGEVPSQNGLRWIVDPIDGTKAFVAGVPMFGILIGLECGDDVLMGVCRLPALNEVIYAATEFGAHWQIGNESPQEIQVSETADLGNALFCYTEAELFERTQSMPAFRAFQQRTRAVRGWGDCYGHMLVATGRAEIIADPLMSSWDAAALVPILREAGGSFTTWNGDSMIHGGNGVSVNAALKDEVLAILNGNA